MRTAADEAAGRGKRRYVPKPVIRSYLMDADSGGGKDEYADAGKADAAFRIMSGKN